MRSQDRFSKVFLLFLFLFFLFSVYSCLSNLNAQSYVSGHLKYQFCCENPSDQITITYLNKFVRQNGDNITDKTVLDILSQSINKDSIVYYSAISDQKQIELFFLYKGNVPIDRADINLVTSHHQYSGYAVNGGLIAPYFSLIGTKIEQPCLLITRQYGTRSFMFRNNPVVCKSILFNSLSFGRLNGDLADMRTVSNSVRYVQDFKDLNWSIIHYQENGIQKVLFRPKTGW